MAFESSVRAILYGAHTSRRVYRIIQNARETPNNLTKKQRYASRRFATIAAKYYCAEGAFLVLPLDTGGKLLRRQHH